VKALIFILLALLLLSACNKRIVPTESVTRVDSVIIREVPRVIEVPGGVVKETVNYDSLRALIQSGIKPEVINRTLIRYDTTGNVQLKLLIDELGNLTAICQAQDQLIETMDKEIQRLSTEVRTITEVREVRFIPAYIWIIIGILALPAAVGTLRLLRLIAI
jgi:hypothetical protein